MSNLFPAQSRLHPTQTHSPPGPEKAPTPRWLPTSISILGPLDNEDTGSNVAFGTSLRSG